MWPVPEIVKSCRRAKLSEISSIIIISIELGLLIQISWACIRFKILLNHALLDIWGSSKSALDINVNPLTIFHEWMVMNESMLTLFGQVLVRHLHTNFHFHNFLLPFLWSRSGSAPANLVIFISINCLFLWSYLLLWNDSTFSTSTTLQKIWFLICKKYGGKVKS